jgi:hypothetical protein
MGNRCIFSAIQNTGPVYVQQHLSTFHCDKITVNDTPFCQDAMTEFLAKKKNSAVTKFIMSLEIPAWVPAICDG